MGQRTGTCALGEFLRRSEYICIVEAEGCGAANTERRQSARQGIRRHPGEDFLLQCARVLDIGIDFALDQSFPQNARTSQLGAVGGSDRTARGLAYLRREYFPERNVLGERFRSGRECVRVRMAARGEEEEGQRTYGHRPWLGHRAASACPGVHGVPPM